MISKEEVKHIAKLARLELSEKEIEKMQKDLSSILDYFNVLKKAPKPKKTDSSVRSEDATRKDNILEDSPNLAKILIDVAPDKKNGYIKVKQVL